MDLPIPSDVTKKALRDIQLGKWITLADLRKELAVMSFQALPDFRVATPIYLNRMITRYWLSVADVVSVRTLMLQRVRNMIHEL